MGGLEVLSPFWKEWLLESLIGFYILCFSFKQHVLKKQKKNTEDHESGDDDNDDDAIVVDDVIVM